ncbi:MAG TPA: flagellar FlbD family protein [Terracidiphilus sp.]|nr:flagellar FlbD family protein [Terracidiphilus sp.]
MIQLTRLNGNALVLNSDLIKTAESSPDTMLTLITGEKFIVREKPEEVVERIVAYRAKLFTTIARGLAVPHTASGLLALSGLNLSSFTECKSPERACEDETSGQ